MFVAFSCQASLLLVRRAEQYLQWGSTGRVGEQSTPRRLLEGQENASMGDERARRFEDALSSLVDNLVPGLDEEDEATADGRHYDALDLAKSIIDE